MRQGRVFLVLILEVHGFGSHKKEEVLVWHVYFKESTDYFTISDFTQIIWADSDFLRCWEYWRCMDLEVARREKFQLRAFVTHFSWKLPVFQVLVINIFYSHCCFEKPFSQVLLHLHDDLYELSILHLWEGIGMRGGHRDHSWSPKWKSQVII